MKIKEFSCTIDTDGNLHIPVDILQTMQISGGDEVRVAYLSEDDGDANTYKELMITSGGLTEAALEEAASEIGEFEIPGDLLVAANIPLDADIEITCVDGAIVISESAAFDVSDELAELLDTLGFPPENVKIIYNTKESGKDAEK